MASDATLLLIAVKSLVSSAETALLSPFVGIAKMIELSVADAAPTREYDVPLRREAEIVTSKVSAEVEYQASSTCLNVAEAIVCSDSESVCENVIEADILTTAVP